MNINETQERTVQIALQELKELESQLSGRIGSLLTKLEPVLLSENNVTNGTVVVPFQPKDTSPAVCPLVSEIGDILFNTKTSIVALDSILGRLRL